MNISKDFELSTLIAGAKYRGGALMVSPALTKVYDLIERIAPFNVTVLVQGASGTGKELVADLLHRLGPNPAGPFVALNCATLIGQLAESQLFGHVRGAFTDARDNALGYFRSAQNGTLFLDEIGELPLELQPKILRAVENHEIQSVGSYIAQKVDVRLVAATNRDLRAMVGAGKFREDLYHRLNAATVKMPTLKERAEDISALAAHFASLHAREIGKQIATISEGALRLLLGHDWPGNVRELSHAIQSAVLATDGARIGVEHLPPYLAGEPQRNDEPAADENPKPNANPRATKLLDLGTLAEGGHASELDAITRLALRRSLEETHGNRQKAAEILGISRQKLYRMIDRYALGNVGREN